LRAAGACNTDIRSEISAGDPYRLSIVCPEAFGAVNRALRARELLATSRFRARGRLVAMNFTVIPIQPDVTSHVREHCRDPVWGHQTTTQLATGFGPCRSCLRTFREGEEERTLFTHDSYAGISDHTQPGPVFVHAEACEPYASDGFPPELRDLSLTFEAIAPGPRVLAVERIAGGDVEAVIERLLATPGVEHVNVRNTEAGCFVARVDPA
jgi:hypothetical protein